VAWTRREVLEALERDSCTLSELASAMGVNRRDAERGLVACIHRGWALRSEYPASPQIPETLSPYVMLTGEGEEALEEMRAANA
jgi:hypothetical protein